MARLNFRGIVERNVSRRKKDLWCDLEMVNFRSSALLEKVIWQTTNEPLSELQQTLRPVLGTFTIGLCFLN
jgi:hypothetical protein